MGLQEKSVASARKIKNIFLIKANFTECHPCSDRKEQNAAVMQMQRVYDGIIVMFYLFVLPL